MNRILFLIASIVFILPFFARAEILISPPSNTDIIKAIVEAASKTRVRASLLYGLIGQETAYGKNTGKTEKEWKSLCKIYNTADCEYWRAYDCKANYNNANKNRIPTSSTCALGFTQFEPQTWWETVKKRGERDKTYNPWNIYDAVLVAAYYL